MSSSLVNCAHVLLTKLGSWKERKKDLLSFCYREKNLRWPTVISSSTLISCSIFPINVWRKKSSMTFVCNFSLFVLVAEFEQGIEASPTLGMQAPSLVDLVEHRSPIVFFVSWFSKHTIFWIISLSQRETWTIMWKSSARPITLFLQLCFSFIQNSKWSCKCIYSVPASQQLSFLANNIKFALLHNLSHIGKFFDQYF